MIKPQPTPEERIKNIDQKIDSLIALVLLVIFILILFALNPCS